MKIEIRQNKMRNTEKEIMDALSVINPFEVKEGIFSMIENNNPREAVINFLCALIKLGHDDVLTIEFEGMDYEVLGRVSREVDVKTSINDVNLASYGEKLIGALKIKDLRDTWVDIKSQLYIEDEEDCFEPLKINDIKDMEECYECISPRRIILLYHFLGGTMGNKLDFFKALKKVSLYEEIKGI